MQPHDKRKQTTKTYTKGTKIMTESEKRPSYARIAAELQAYLHVYLPEYELEEMRRKSPHPDDWYLYIAAAKNKTNGTYAVWSAWNASTKSLNHGHYNIPDWKTCRKTMDELYNH